MFRGLSDHRVLQERSGRLPFICSRRPSMTHKYGTGIFLFLWAPENSTYQHKSAISNSSAVTRNLISFRYQVDHKKVRLSTSRQMKSWGILKKLHVLSRNHAGFPDFWICGEMRPPRNKERTPKGATHLVTQLSFWQMSSTTIEMSERGSSSLKRSCFLPPHNKIFICGGRENVKRN